jgi:hypothetical protein
MSGLRMGTWTLSRPPFGQDLTNSNPTLLGAGTRFILLSVVSLTSERVAVAHLWRGRFGVPIWDGPSADGFPVMFPAVRV